MPPSERQDLSSTYYYMYNYTNVIDMLNTNLLDAMTKLIDEFTVLSDQDHIRNYVTPFFEIDPDSCKIVLNIHERGTPIFRRSIFKYSIV